MRISETSGGGGGVSLVLLLLLLLILLSPEAGLLAGPWPHAKGTCVIDAKRRVFVVGRERGGEREGGRGREGERETEKDSEREKTHAAWG